EIKIRKLRRLRASGKLGPQRWRRIMIAMCAGARSIGGSRMHQGWFQVAGLLLDFAGVMLLAYEWLVSFIAQRREEELLDRGDRELKTLAFAQSSVRDERMAAHYEHVMSRAKDHISEQSGAIKRAGHHVRLP